MATTTAINTNVLISNNKSKSLMIKILLTVFVMFLALLMLMPFLYMISSSLKTEIDIFKYPVEWIPKQFKNNYKTVWLGNDGIFFTYYYNSIKVTVLSLVGLLASSSMAAFAFTKLNFKGRDKLFLLYLATIMIPNQVILVPRFILFKYLNINNTHLALILPNIFIAYGVFLLRQFMISVPNELCESARIDGASDLKIWYKIIIPLTKPAMITLAIISVVWSWNDYENPLVFLSSRSLYTITLGLQSFMDETGKFYSLIMAAAVSATLPPLILVLVGQKYIIGGLTAGAVKG